MTTHPMLLLLMTAPLFLFGAAADSGHAPRLAESYQEVYAGEDATGEHVLALWLFDGDDPGADISGNGHDAVLNGAAFVEEGRFGGALHSQRGWPDADKPHQAVVRNSPALTPEGAFTVEMWICPAPDLTDYANRAILMDKKYASDRDYQLLLSREQGENRRRVEMDLGFGVDSQRYISEYLHWTPGVWRHIAFVYDGAGSGRFFGDGASIGGQTYPERGNIAPGNHNLSIGDRVGSNYHGFPGRIDQVRISNEALEFRDAATTLQVPRRVFVRMEEAPALELEVTNLRRDAMAGARLIITLDKRPTKQITLPELAAGEHHVLSFAFDTSLRPDTYMLGATVVVGGDEGFRSTEYFEITLVPRPLPYRMPVVLWGNVLDNLDDALDIGFTHGMGVDADFNAVWTAETAADVVPPGRIATTMTALDEALRRDMRVISNLSPGRWARGQTDYARIQADGERYEDDDACGLFPRVQQFCHDVGVFMTRDYGAHPAWEGAMIHTEVRDHTRPCFHDHDRAAFRAYAGYDIPEGVQSMRGIPHGTIHDFPEDRVIPDDYPLYVYYRWLWRQGDGWNRLHTQLHQGLKTGARNEFWTFHDPATRCASVFGSGGDVDFLSHWTYSYPDPVRIGLVTDELFCMAAGADRPDQQVMKMTQIIWYRSQTAPEPGEEAQTVTADFIDQDTRPDTAADIEAPAQHQAGWERNIPDARFITIAPMHLREAFWAKMARPIQGIMYHGWGSLVEEVEHRSYRYTHPDTRHELRRLVREVVEPLGPALMQVPDRPADVAMLESFASEMFAGRGTYGWNSGWAGEMYLILLYAGLQPRILFEETIQREGLDTIKVLVMPDCDVLPASVVEAVQRFQRGGGIIVGDNRLCPAITPDIRLEVHNRPKEADRARNMNLEKARELREKLDSRYERYVETSTPDIIPRVRAYGGTDYLFAVNDKREFGDYVGHHGMVMENGLPVNAALTVAREGHVYDLVGNCPAPALSESGRLSFDWHFGPCDGRVFMITERPIAGLRVQAPDQLSAGSTANISVAVLDDAGDALDAVVPVEVYIEDPNGRAAEFSGYYGAAQGQLHIEAHIAANDTPGMWRIRVRELASGSAADAYMRVAGP